MVRERVPSRLRLVHPSQPSPVKRQNRDKEHIKAMNTIFKTASIEHFEPFIMHRKQKAAKANAKAHKKLIFLISSKFSRLKWFGQGNLSDKD